MADVSRQQKLASAKKKLKKYQQNKSPDGLSPTQEKLGKEILQGFQNNHIFKTPPLTVSSNNKQETPSSTTNEKTPTPPPPTTPSVTTTPTPTTPNQKLNFSTDDKSYFAPKRNSSPVPNPTTSRTSSPVPPSTLPGVESTSEKKNVVEGGQVVVPLSVTKTHPALDFSDNSSTCSDDVSKEKLLSEDLEGTLASYKRANNHLGNQVNEQRKLIRQLQDQVRREGLSTAQLNEQRALKEQLEVHIQTIGILVSEKSELQTSNSNMQKQLTTKESDLEGIGNQLKDIQQQCLDYQKNIAQLQAAEGQMKQMSKEVIQERDRFSGKLYEVSQEKEELALMNSELHSKLQVKVDECKTFLNQVNQLHLKLQQGELMVHQLSANGIDINNLTKWNEEKEELLKKVDQQNEMIKKLVYDKAELLEKHSETQGHYDVQIEQLKNTINAIENEKKHLTEKANALTERIEDLQTQLAKANEVKAVDTPEVDRDMKFNVELDNTRQEKAHLESELDIQIKENRRLQLVVREQNVNIEALESKLQELRDDSSDKASLLEQIQADQETISRAMTQNKSLKEQLEELEDGFVKVSNSNADLVDKLDAEQHGNSDVAEKLSQMQVELEENRIQLTEKTETCENLTSQLENYQNAMETAKVKIENKDMDMEVLSTELETTKNELAKKEENLQAALDTSKLVEKLQQELDSAQNAFNLLSLQNVELTSQVEHLVSEKEQLEASREHMEEESPNELDGDLYPDREHFDMTSSSQEDETEEESLEVQRSFEGLDNESIVSDMTDIEDNEAMLITREKMQEMEHHFQELQEERNRMMDLVEEERKRSESVLENMESHVELQVSQCLKQKERELNEHFYEQTEALQNKCRSLQEALEIMRKDENISEFDMETSSLNMQSLKTAFIQLQKRYKKAMDSKAQLADRIDQLEHINQKLENETETIGEYIMLYQAQRAALKKKFEDKDHVIQQLTSEHGRMQTKVTQLHQLVMQMLNERSGIENKNKHLQELVNKRLAIPTGNVTQDGDVTQDDIDNLIGEVNDTCDEESETCKECNSIGGEETTSTFTGNNTTTSSITTSNNDEGTLPVEDQTAQQILQLFEQLETSGEGLQPGWLSAAARKHTFLPCKNCMGPLESI